MNDLLNWARLSSLWPLSLRDCLLRYRDDGIILPRHMILTALAFFSKAIMARQSDVIIIAGTVTFKMAERIKRLYEQMPEPKYVISMGSCSNCGGPYWQHGYHVVKGRRQGDTG